MQIVTNQCKPAFIFFQKENGRGGDAFDLTTGVWSWPLIMNPIAEDQKWKGKQENIWVLP